MLARLAGQEVERERQELGALDAELEQQRASITRKQAAIERECHAAGEPESARLLATWLPAARQRLHVAQGELEGLEGARAAQLARLVERRLELKRMELLQARRQARREADARVREQRTIDELALLRAARRPAD